MPSAVDELIYGPQGEVPARPWHSFEFDLLTGDEYTRSGKSTKLLMYPVPWRTATGWLRCGYFSSAGVDVAGPMPHT